jgi:hypothetical protein
MHDKTAPLSPNRFWQEVYIAAVRNGRAPSEALTFAQKALTDYQKLASGSANG